MPVYDFSTLSPIDFEHVVRDIMNADLGMDLRGYAPGRDQGIDLRQVTADGKVVVVQCKHYVASSWSTFLGAVRKEAKKGSGLATDRYLFATSRDLTPAQETKIIAELQSLGVADDGVWGRNRLNGALGRHPEVEKQHVKLWLASTTVLETLLGSGRWQRGEATLAEIRDQSRLWVDTPMYADSLEILEREGACIVYGPPGVGKTFLAQMILMSAAAQGWDAVHVSGDIEDAWRALRTDSSNQLFYYNDFLGETELTLGSKNEPTQLAKFITRIRQLRAHKRFVLATREQILQQASIDYDPIRAVTTDIARLGVRLNNYPMQVRGEILFNQLYFSDIPEEERDLLAVDGRIIDIVEHPSFNPRLVHTVIQSAPSSAEGKLSAIRTALDRPEEVWETSFRGLADTARQILLTLATIPPGYWPVETVRGLATFVDPLAWRPSLRILEPSWITTSGAPGAKVVSLANPSCRDYLYGLLDDVAVADELLRHVRVFDQVVWLTKTAGLTAGASAATTRPELGHALMQRGGDLVALCRDHLASHPNAAARALREAALLFNAYGQETDCTWFISHVVQVMNQDDAIATGSADLFTLSDALAQIETEDMDGRAALTEKVDLLAAQSMETSRDLDAYENLPDALKTPSVEAAARQRAQEVLGYELDHLLRTASAPDAIRAGAAELEQRAGWHHVEIDIGPLLDRADDLTTAELPDAPWPESNDDSLEKDGIAAVRDIFARFEELPLVMEDRRNA